MHLNSPSPEEASTRCEFLHQSSALSSKTAPLLPVKPQKKRILSEMPNQMCIQALSMAVASFFSLDGPGDFHPAEQQPQGCLSVLTFCLCPHPLFFIFLSFRNTLGLDKLRAAQNSFWIWKAPSLKQKSLCLFIYLLWMEQELVSLC